MIKSKYKEKELELILKSCTTIADGLRKLNLKPNGGHGLLRKLIKKILVNQGTYLGQHHKKNLGKIRKENNEIFVENSNLSSFKVKSHLFKRNIKKRICENCLNTNWLKNKIPLELHHKDGNPRNNKIKNLQILCPNCHAFTCNYRGKNIKKIIHYE